MRFVLCAASFGVLLCSTANAQPQIVGSSATYWTETDSIEFVVWLSAVPNGDVPLWIGGWQYDRHPELVDRYNTANAYDPGWSGSELIGYTGDKRYDRRFYMTGSISGDAADVNIQTGVVVHNDPFWDDIPSSDTGRVTDYTLYTIDAYPNEDPQYSSRQARVMREVYGGEPKAAWVASVPLADLGFTKGGFLYYQQLLFHRSYEDERVATFIPEPSSVALAFLGVVLLGIHLIRRCRVSRSPCPRVSFRQAP